MDHEENLAMNLATEAFNRFGTAFLWNVRQPATLQPGENAVEYARRLARRLTIAGNQEAMALGHKMLKDLEHVGPISGRNTQSSHG